MLIFFLLWDHTFWSFTTNQIVPPFIDLFYLPMHFGQLVHIVVIVLIFSLKRTAFASENVLIFWDFYIWVAKRCLELWSFFYIRMKLLFWLVRIAWKIGNESSLLRSSSLFHQWTLQFSKSKFQFCQQYSLHNNCGLLNYYIVWLHCMTM